LDGDEQISKKEFKKIITILLQENEGEDIAKNLGPGVDFLTQVAYQMVQLLNLALLIVSFKFDRQGGGSLNYNEWRRYAEEEDKIQDFVENMTDRFAEEFPTLAAK
jgi:hypothetical protein